MTRFYCLPDNELVSVDWVALLEALRFLDCSSNRLSALSTFAGALAHPPRLEEVIAEGNPVGHGKNHTLYTRTGQGLIGVAAVVLDEFRLQVSNGDSLPIKNMMAG